MKQPNRTSNAWVLSCDEGYPCVLDDPQAWPAGYQAYVLLSSLAPPLALTANHRHCMCGMLCLAAATILDINSCRIYFPTMSCFAWLELYSEPLQEQVASCRHDLPTKQPLPGTARTHFTRSKFRHWRKAIHPLSIAISSPAMCSLMHMAGHG